MNIFFLSRNPETAAEYMCDKHVVKMVVETAQMLSTAHRLLDGKEKMVPYTDKAGRKRWRKHYELPDNREDKLYKVAHPHHPCVKWVVTHLANYRWLYRHFKALCGEYTERYGKAHKSSQLLSWLAQPPVCMTGGSGGITEPPQAMPEHYQQKDVVKAYRMYYIGDKSYMAKWKTGRVPFWMQHEEVGEGGNVLAEVRGFNNPVNVLTVK